MDLLDNYLGLQKQIFDYFGYVEDYVVIPIDDRRSYYWALDDVDSKVAGAVRYAETLDDLYSFEAGEYYEDEIYTQRFLPKWVYEADDFTMICVDTHTDGNKFLAIFDNKKRQCPDKYNALLEAHEWAEA